jgi:excisionase family DNA binding protein
MTVDGELLDIHSAAARLRVSESTVKNEVRRGRLGSVKLRDRRLIPPSAIERYIDLLKEEADGADGSKRG